MSKTYTPPREKLEPLVTHEQIDSMVAEAVGRFQAEQPAGLTPEQEIRARLDQARFQEMVASAAIASGVRPRAVRLVVRDAASQFELRDGVLAPRHDETDPSDPLSPLSITRWLEGLRATDGYLFAG
jgi:hypothetical protein